MKNSIAIITARGGSKRIPRKNIRMFIDKPIIAFPIQVAIKSKLFDEVMVSTDDNEIAEIAKKYGAHVPFIRSRKNSDDYATSADVVKEIIEDYEKLGKRFDYVCCIYPTASFITIKILKETNKMIIEKAVDSVIPVVRFGYPIQRALKMADNNLVSFFYPKHMMSRSQDLMNAFHDAGQFYWLNVNSFKRQQKIFMKHTLGLEILERYVQDIDTEYDWEIAEIKYRIQRKI